MDLNTYSRLQVAALRLMTSDSEVAGRCDAWLREQHMAGLRHLPIRLFARLAAGGLMFLWVDFDDEAPTKRELFWSGATVAILLSVWVGFIVLLMAQVHSWPWRGAILLGMALTAAVENWRIERRSRR